MESRGDRHGGVISSAGVRAGSSSRFISQIFWPEHCLNLGGRRGYVIGWNTASFKCLVVTLVTVDAETGLPTLAQTERALEVLSSHPRCRTLNEFCSFDGAPPTVLGEWLPTGQHSGAGSSPAFKYYDSGSAASSAVSSASAAAAAEAAAAKRQTSNIWLTMGQKAGRPMLRSLYCCGCAYRTCCYVVFYRPCNPDVLEYLPTVRKRHASAYDNSDSGDDDAEDFVRDGVNGNGGGSNIHNESSGSLDREGQGTDAASGSELDGEGGAGVTAVEWAATGVDGGVSRRGGGQPADRHLHDPHALDKASAGSKVNEPSSSRIRNSASRSSGNSHRSSQQDLRRTRNPGDLTNAISHTNRSFGRRRVSVGSSSGAGSSGRGDAGLGGSAGLLRRGRVGHGTALVSPSARERNNSGGGLARDAAGLMMGGGSAGVGGAGGGAEDPTDLDFAIRQVSCALTLERALRDTLRDVLIADKRSDSTQPSPPAVVSDAAASTTSYGPEDGEVDPPQRWRDDSFIDPPISSLHQRGGRANKSTASHNVIATNSEDEGAGERGEGGGQEHQEEEGRGHGSVTVERDDGGSLERCDHGVRQHGHVLEDVTLPTPVGAASTVVTAVETTANTTVATTETTDTASGNAKDADIGGKEQAVSAETAVVTVAGGSRIETRTVAGETESAQGADGRVREEGGQERAGKEKTVSFDDDSLAIEQRGRSSTEGVPTEAYAAPSISTESDQLLEDEEDEKLRHRSSPAGGDPAPAAAAAAAGSADVLQGTFSGGKPPLIPGNAQQETVRRRKKRKDARDSSVDGYDDGRGNARVSRRLKGERQGRGSEERGRGERLVGIGLRSGRPVGVNNVSLPGRVLLDGFCLLLRVVSWVGFSAVRVLEAKIVWTPLGNDMWRCLSDASLVCAHLEARLKNALSLPLRLSKCWRERHQPAERRVESLVGLSHGLCGLASDQFLGVVACVLLLRHTGAAARAAHRALHLLHVDVLREEIEWLNYFPGGFKLNVPLTHTLGSLTLVGMEAYASIVGKLAQWEGAMMTAIAICAAAGGLTAALAVCHDVLRLLTLHTATAHTAFAGLHNLHSSLLGSLWQLFRGRKWNVLRCRVDTCMYDACQLLLGTLVFTVLSFLTPTISVYYTFFCIVQAVAVGGQAVLICMFVLINELPVYRLLVMLTNPSRLLAGFQLQVLDTARPSTSSPSAAAVVTRGHGVGRGESVVTGIGGGGIREDPTMGGSASTGSSIQWEDEANMVYFQLQRCRAPVSALLQPYIDRARRVVRRYPPGTVVKSLVSGKPLPDVGFRDFVTVRPVGGLGRWASAGGGLERAAGDGDEYGVDGEQRTVRAFGVGGAVAAAELVHMCRSLWLEYCYGGC